MHVDACVAWRRIRYLFDYIQRVADSNRHCLKSWSSLQLTIRRTRVSTVGDRAFPVVGSRLWNNLPRDVTSAPMILIAVFSKRLNKLDLPFPVYCLITISSFSSFAHRV